MNSISQYAWVKEIDYMKHLDDDSKLIVEEFGIETYIKLFLIFGKTRIYFNNKFFYECKKVFIKTNLENYTTRQLSKMLNVSEEFVRREKS